MFKHNTDIKKAIDHLKNDKNNAISEIFENATNSSGILSKTTYVLKDIFATKDYVTEASSNILKKFRSFYNATIVEKLNNAGAALVGKSNLDELGLGGTGTFSSNGIIKNPLDNKRLVGGSSSGSAAIFNDKISFSIGTDTGDSVRLPASYIGKVGFKPSYGSVSRYGLFPFASSLDTVAWFTHNVNDSNVIAKVLFGKDEKDFTTIKNEIALVKKIKPKKIGILNCFNFLEQEVKINYEKIIKLLKNENIKIELINIPENILNSILTTYQIISYSEAYSNLANLSGISFGNTKKGDSWEDIMTKTRSLNFGYMVQKRLTLGAYFLDLENQDDLFLRAQKVRRILKNIFLKFFNNRKIDILVMPSYPDTAQKFGSDFSCFTKKYKYMSSILAISNLVGNPSISIPWMKNSKNKMPVNLSIDAAIYKDKKLFEHSLYIEKLIAKINNKGNKNDK